MPLAIKLNEKYTYADYLTWPEDERWEIIDGVPYNMAPAPNTEHQTISGKISGELYIFLREHDCQLFAAPFDVRLSETQGTVGDDKIKTVVQPDIMVICDKNKLDNQGCKGAPDIAVEILSASTAYKDETYKLNLYERHGVKEYWIVNPEAKYIMVYRLHQGKFNKPEYLIVGDILESQVLNGFKLELGNIWDY